MCYICFIYTPYGARLNLVAIYANTDIRISKPIETQPNLEHPIGSYGARLGPIETYWTTLKCMFEFEHTKTYRKTTKPISPYWTLWGPLEAYQNISEHNTRTLLCWTRWSPSGPYRNIWKHIKRTFQVNHVNTKRNTFKRIDPPIAPDRILLNI